MKKKFSREFVDRLNLTLQANRLVVLDHEVKKGNKRVMLVDDVYYWYENVPAKGRTYGTAVKAPVNNWVEYCAETGKVLSYGDGRKTVVYNRSHEDVQATSWANSELNAKFLVMKGGSDDSND